MERQKFFIIGKVHVLIIIIKKRSIKKPLKKGVKKKIWKTHTHALC